MNSLVANERVCLSENKKQRAEELKTKEQKNESKRAWHASLQLEFAARHSKTVLSNMRFEGPLRVQRPFYPEQDVCHMYVLHPPGGMVSGDHLVIDCVAQEAAQCLITTPSAGKIYGADSNNGEQIQDINLALDHGVCFEWLPQETIIFDRANALLNTHFQLKSDSLFMGWDMVCLGRKYGDEPFDTGAFRQTLTVRVDEKTVLLEKLRFDADSDLRQAAFGLLGCNAFGTFVIQCEDAKAAVETIREVLPASAQGCHYSVTQKMGLVFCRGIDQSIEKLREQFIAIWKVMRKPAIGKDVCVPRIWNT